MSRSTEATNAAILVIGKVLADLSEALILIVLVRLVGKLDVGILTEILLFHTTLTMVLTGGLPATISYYLPSRTPPERRAIAFRVTALLFGLGLLAGLLMLGVSVFAIQLHAPETLLYFAALAPFPVGDIPIRMLPNLLVVENRAQQAALVGIVRAAAMTSATLVPLALGMSLWKVVICLSSCGVLFAVCTLVSVHRLYAGIERRPCPISSRQILSFGVPLGLTEIVVNLNNRFDRYLIALAFSASAYAVYQAGAWQIPLIPSISYAVGVAYAPLLVRLFNQQRPEEAVRVWREQSKKTALLVVPLAAVFVVASEETIELLFTAQYLDAAFVFRCFSAMTMGRITAFGTILVSAGKPGYVIRSAVVAFLANVALSTSLLFLVGFQGPALGTLLAFIPMVCAYNWYIAKASGMQFNRVFPLADYLKVLAVTVAAATPAVAFKLLVHLPAAWKLAIEASLLFACFGALGTAVGLIERDDWHLVLEWARLRRPGRRTA